MKVNNDVKLFFKMFLMSGIFIGGLSVLEKRIPNAGAILYGLPIGFIILVYSMDKSKVKQFTKISIISVIFAVLSMIGFYFLINKLSITESFIISMSLTILVLFVYYNVSCNVSCKIKKTSSSL